MSLQNKFFTYFAGIALVPMIIVGIFSLLEIQNRLARTTIDHLSSVANLQKARVNEILERHIQEVKLVTSNTQLRQSLADFNRDHDIGSLKSINDTLVDSKNSISSIQEILLIDLNGLIIASTDPILVDRKYEQTDYFSLGQKNHVITRLFKNDDNILQIELVGPFLLDGKNVGMVSMIVGAETLVNVTEDYTGLGKTGEVTLASKNKAGDALFLTPLRFDAGAALARVISTQSTGNPMLVAIAGEERVFIERGIIDYKNDEIIAVTRYIDATGWGLVAKINRSEAFSEVGSFTYGYLLGALLIFFIVMALSFFVSNTFALPLGKLIFGVKALEKGDFSSRIKVRGHDEIGRLGEAFNFMATKLQESYRGLEEKIKERTQQLEKEKAKDEAMLASIGDGLVAVDKAGKIMLVNKAFEHMLGLRAGEVYGKKFGEIGIVTSESGKVVQEENLLISKVLSGNMSVVVNVNRYYRHKNGAVFPVMVSVSPIIMANNVVGAVNVFRDITKEKEIDKAKTEFVSLASHQLRTPLSTVNWYAEMLLDGDVGKLKREQKDYVEEIYAGNKRMVELVNALLNVSRIEMGTFAIDPESTNLGSLLKGVADELQTNVKNREINFSIFIDQRLPAVSVDPKIMRIVFQNLLTNAIKYTTAGGAVKASICLKRAGEIIGENPLDKDSFLITVSDTGWGIPDNQKGSIFTKLFRADNVREKDTEGTGLGLYIVKSIIDRAGGHIWFESPYFDNSSGDKTLIQGTKFSILFPKTGRVVKSGAKPLEAQNKV